MADFDMDRDAFFVATVFRPAGIEVLCGRGNGYAIRDFAEHEATEDSGRWIARLKRQFPACRTLAALSRAAAEAWLGRSFLPAE
jgi:hypothetical protein